MFFIVLLVLFAVYTHYSVWRAWRDGRHRLAYAKFKTAELELRAGDAAPPEHEAAYKELVRVVGRAAAEKRRALL